MKQLIRSCMGWMFASALLAGFALNPAVAQDKAKAPAAEKGKAAYTLLKENDKLRAVELRQKPGDVNELANTATRVVRVLKGGTFLRTDADGKTTTLARKTGDVYILEPGPKFTTKNIGKTEIVLYVVFVK